MEVDEIRICIIGAGPAGLCSLHHVLSSSLLKNSRIHATLFEQQDDIGGLWNYSGSEVKLRDANGNPLIFPMYSDLRCNLPKQLMEFQDFKHGSNISTFATQKEIHDYLQKYSNHFRLWPNIKLNCRILKVKPIEKGDWLVTVENTKTFALANYVFHAIMCCVGVNFYPKIPTIDGMAQFRGGIIHSKYFKESEEFRGKHVVCLGLGPSCADLCLKLAPVAKQVVACHRFPGGFCLGLLPPNVRETASIVRLNEWSVTTESGEEIQCDVLVLCTGYHPFFPFLDGEIEETIVDENDSIINHLYKKIFLPNYPTFCFINAHGQAAEFLMMEVQAKYFVSYLEGKITLPPLSVMEIAIAKDNGGNKAGNKSRRKLTNSLRGERFALTEVCDYLEGLAKEGGYSKEFPHIPLHLHVFQWVIGRIFGSLAVYRNDTLRVLAPNIWEYKCAAEVTHSNTVKPSRVKIFHLAKNGAVMVKDIKRN